MAAHSSVLAWRIPEAEEHDGLPSMGLHRVGHDWSDLAAAAAAQMCIVSTYSPWRSLVLLESILGLVVHYKNRYIYSNAAAKSLHSCPTLCDPIDGSPPGSPVPGILQARTLQWVAISFSNAWKWKVKLKSFSRVQLLATPWTAAYQAPLSMGFSRQEYWSGVPSPSPFIAISCCFIFFILFLNFT